jgi:Sugar phosphate isomerases/epimerases
MKRRRFLASLAAFVPVVLCTDSRLLLAEEPVTSLLPSLPVKTRISLNVFSFDRALRDGLTNIPGVLDFAAQTGFDAVDITGYFFPGYPNVPPDDYLFDLKHRAFRLGLEICGTGIKNDFTNPDPEARKLEKQLVKDWIVVASKLGAQTLRIFAGLAVPEGYTWKQAAEWIAADIEECAQFAQQYGVFLALQNHDDFIKTSDDVETLLQMIHSDWVGLMLDIGSYRSGDPYDEIAKTIKYAITWQVKEEVYINDKRVPTDFDRLKKIVDASSYRGYFPVETLGQGDPKVKVVRMFEELKKRFG